MDGCQRALLVCGLVSVMRVAAAGGIAEAMRATPFAGASFEASGATAVPGTRAVLMVADSRPGEVLWMELAPDGAQKGDIRAVPLGVEIADPEGITSDGTWFYVVGSQEKRADGAGLVRFRFDPSSMTALDVQSVDGLAGFLKRTVPELRDTDDLNIEGLAWDPRHGRLLLGLRAPLIDGDAVIVPLEVQQGDRPLSHGTLGFDGGIFRLRLDGDGIRGMEYDRASERFLVIAGASGGRERTSRLLEWTGDVGAAPRQLAAFDGALKPEGIARAGELRLIVCDTSRFIVLR